MGKRALPGTEIHGADKFEWVGKTVLRRAGGWTNGVVKRGGQTGCTIGVVKRGAQTGWSNGVVKRGGQTQGVDWGWWRLWPRALG
jgi:hypothetical protein